MLVVILCIVKEQCKKTGHPGCSQSQVAFVSGGSYLVVICTSPSTIPHIPHSPSHVKRRINDCE